MKTLKLFAGLLVAAFAASAQQYNITTVAGDGGQGYVGDGGPATQAGFALPTRVALDSKGKLYIVDYLSYVVRVVDTSGNITTLAGNGTSGFLGDTLTGTQVAFSTIHGIAVDGSGNVFLADTGNSRIRRIDGTSGVVSTFAGNGTFGYTGDGGAASAAEIERPGSIAIDSSGNLYVPDYAASVVRKITSSGTISTFAGTGTFGNAGDGGPATKALLGAPVAVAVDPAGNVYVSDSTYGVIRKITSDGNIQTVATGVDAQSFGVDAAGNIYYPNYLNNTVNRIAPGGAQLAIAGNGTPGYSGDGSFALNAQLNYPYGVLLDGKGNIYVADAYNYSVRLLTPISSPLAIVSAASNLGGTIAPGELVAIYGTNIGPATAVTSKPVNGVYPTNVGGTFVVFDGAAGAILYASPTQVIAQVPYEVNIKPSAQVTLSYNGALQKTYLPINWTAPALFTANGSGTGQIAAVNQDGSLNSIAKPAKSGSIVALYITGEGYLAGGVDGAIAPNPAPIPVKALTVLINNQPATVLYAGGSPGSVEGLLQVNVQVPQIPTALTASGPVAVPVVVQGYGGNQSQTAVTLAVTN